MTYLVTDICIGCKHTDCIEVCPVDCFHEGENFIVIDPDECVDCGLCEIECPVDAICSESNLHPHQLPLLALNADLSRCWPKIIERKTPLPDADHWADKKDKLPMLIR